MEKIERLAHLHPVTDEVSGHGLEMFRVLRGFAMMDWAMRHPNDLGRARAEQKFEALVEKTWELMDSIQGEIEAKAPPVEEKPPSRIFLPPIQ